jgi:hypothetical protein
MGTRAGRSSGLSCQSEKPNNDADRAVAVSQAAWFGRGDARVETWRTATRRRGRA